VANRPRHSAKGRAFLPLFLKLPLPLLLLLLLLLLLPPRPCLKLPLLLLLLPARQLQSMSLRDPPRVHMGVARLPLRFAQRCCHRHRRHCLRRGCFLQRGRRCSRQPPRWSCATETRWAAAAA
jgi:hypothetical protein